MQILTLPPSEREPSRLRPESFRGSGAAKARLAAVLKTGTRMKKGARMDSNNVLRTGTVRAATQRPKPLATGAMVFFHLVANSPEMPLPYKLATLLYCFNEREEVLLLERAQEPNLGLWSPCGGKLRTDTGESPYACACREAREELGLILQCSDLHLTGLVSEHGYQGQSHWLMFLFEVGKRLTSLPPAHREGTFRFFPRAAMASLKMPQTDVERIWPWFWQHRGGFFAAHCHCHPDGRNDWTLEESSIHRKSKV